MIDGDHLPRGSTQLAVRRLSTFGEFVNFLERNEGQWVRMSWVNSRGQLAWAFRGPLGHDTYDGVEPNVMLAGGLMILERLFEGAVVTDPQSLTAESRTGTLDIACEFDVECESVLERVTADAR